MQESDCIISLDIISISNDYIIEGLCNTGLSGAIAARVEQIGCNMCWVNRARSAVTHVHPQCRLGAESLREWFQRPWSGLTLQ